MDVYFAFPVNIQLSMANIKKIRLQQLNASKMHLVIEKNFPHRSMDREGIVVSDGESGAQKHPERNCTYFMATGRELRHLPSSKGPTLNSKVYREASLVLLPWCTHTGLSVSPAFCTFSSSHWPVVQYVGLWSRIETGLFSYLKRTAITVLTGPGVMPQPHVGDLLWWSTGSHMAGQRSWRWIACIQEWSSCGKVGGTRHVTTGWRTKERS